jgi:hypothetical protein
MVDLFYADETAVRPEQGDFFLYGGVIVPSEKARDLDLALREINYTLEPNMLPLKWNIDGLTTKERVAQFKGCEEYLRAAGKYGARVNFVVIAHAILRADYKRGWQIEHVIGALHDSLRADRHSKRVAVVLIDTYGAKEEAESLRTLAVRCFSKGTWNGRYTVDRIIGIHEAYSGSSHFSGLTDIAMNALRLVVSEKQNQPRAEKWAKLLRPICELTDIRGKKYVRLGAVEPATVELARYHPLYKEMLERTAKLGIPLYHRLLLDER